MRNPRLLPAILVVAAVAVLAVLTVMWSGEPAPAPTPTPSAATPSTSAPSPSIVEVTPSPTDTAVDTAEAADPPSPDRPPGASPAPGTAGPAVTPTPPDADTGADADGDRLVVELTAAELSAAATDGLPPEAPVEAIELTPREGPDGGALLDVRAEVSGLPVDLTGEIAVEVTDGRLTPRLLEAQVGPFALPEPVRATIDDVLDGLGERIVAPEWDIQAVRVVDEELVVEAVRA